MNPHLHVAGEPLSYWVGHSEGLSVADYAAQVHRLGVWGGLCAAAKDEGPKCMDL